MLTIMLNIKYIYQNYKVIIILCNIYIMTQNILDNYKVIDIKSINCDIYNEKDINAMILYSHNGDKLLKYYTYNNYIVNDELVNYFKNIYIESLEKYKVHFVSEDLKRGFINIYVKNLYLQLLNTFKQSFDYDTLWFRGMKTILNVKLNESIVVNQFWSTTNDIEIALSFGKNLIYILCPKNVKLSGIVCHSKHTSESEFLFPDRSTFKCIYIEKKGQNYIYYLLFTGFKDNDKVPKDPDDIKLYDFTDKEIQMYKNYVIGIETNNIENLNEYIRDTSGNILNYRLTNNLIYMIENYKYTLLEYFIKELIKYKIEIPEDFYEIYNVIIEKKPKEHKILSVILKTDITKKYPKLNKLYNTK
jgi:hypothetical protein